MDLLLWGLVLLAAALGLSGLMLLLPERHPTPSTRTPAGEEPESLTAGRGLAELQKNVFPHQHDRPCPCCNARVLIWHTMVKRRDAWLGRCRRCGVPRVQLVGGLTQILR